MIKTDNQTTILNRVLDSLWAEYSNRVSYAKVYEKEVKLRGGELANDHIAFRSFYSSSNPKIEGRKFLERIFTSLGYRPIDEYIFKQKQLTATHYQHSDNSLPKIFISEYDIDNLPEDLKNRLETYFNEINETYFETYNFTLVLLEKIDLLNDEMLNELEQNLENLFTRAWTTPMKADVIQLNEISQYAAWTLIHGNSVNHFTAYINEQKVSSWSNIEETLNSMSKLGVPLKKKIEGKQGSKLRQSSTEAVKEIIELISDTGEKEKVEWTYAYYEFAERGYIEENGERKLFTGFLGEQATHLFDMTSYTKE